MALLISDNHLPASQQPARVYLASLAPGSRPAMRGCLDFMAQLLTRSAQARADAIDWSAIRFQHAAALRAELADRFSPAHTNKHLAALRGVLKAAYGLGQISPDDYARFTQIKGVRGQTLPKGRSLTEDEMAALLAACAADATPAGRRDAAMIALMWSVGPRRAEICQLALSDYDMAMHSLRVLGKGRKERLLPVEWSLGRALEAWLLERGQAPGAFFCPVRKGGKIALQHLKPEAVWAMLRKRARQAGLAGVTPHDLRRTFVSDLLDAGTDIVTVQKIAGHANVTTTARYDRRGEEAKQQAVRLRPLPR